MGASPRIASWRSRAGAVGTRPIGTKPVTHCCRSPALTWRVVRGGVHVRQGRYAVCTGGHRERRHRASRPRTPKHTRATPTAARGEGDGDAGGGADAGRVLHGADRPGVRCPARSAAVRRFARAGCGDRLAGTGHRHVRDTGAAGVRPSPSDCRPAAALRDGLPDDRAAQSGEASSSPSVASAVSRHAVGRSFIAEAGYRARCARCDDTPAAVPCGTPPSVGRDAATPTAGKPRTRRRSW